MQLEVQLGEQGQIQIPALLRKALGFHAGEKLIAKDNHGQLIIEKESIIKSRLRTKFSKIPKDIDLAQELIEERNHDAINENAKI
ncbi:MAG: AbrB/MazE/SpoVT family DNA-binding domain-containing protein [Pseudomonadota bacterium]